MVLEEIREWCKKWKPVTSTISTISSLGMVAVLVLGLIAIQPFFGIEEIDIDATRIPTEPTLPSLGEIFLIEIENFKDLDDAVVSISHAVVLSHMKIIISVQVLEPERSGEFNELKKIDSYDSFHDIDFAYLESGKKIKIMVAFKQLVPFTVSFLERGKLIGEKTFRF